MERAQFRLQQLAAHLHPEGSLSFMVIVDAVAFALALLSKIGCRFEEGFLTIGLSFDKLSQYKVVITYLMYSHVWVALEGMHEFIMPELL